MPRAYMCPYWKWERKEEISCEGCRVYFRSAEAKDAFAARRCADLNGWRACCMAKYLEEIYERGKNDEGDKRQKNGAV